MARLGLVTSQGQFQASSFWLSAQALPLVIAVTWRPEPGWSCPPARQLAGG